MAKAKIESIDDAVEAAFAASETGEEVELDTSDEEEDAYEAEEPEEEEVSEPEEEDGQEEDGADPYPSAVEPEPLEPPRSLDATAREEFQKLPRAAQEILVKRERDLVSGFQRQLGQYQAHYGKLEQSIEPHRSYLQEEGLDPSEIVGNLLAWHKYIAANPAQALQTLAKDFGVELGGQVQAGQQSQTSQNDSSAAIQKLIQSQDQLRAYIAKKERDQKIQALTQEVYNFRQAKDANGKPKYPYASEVENDIARLIPLIRQESPGASAAELLDAAYNKAVRLNDSVFQKLQASRGMGSASKVERARKAGASLRGKPLRSPAPEISSLEDAVERAFELHS
jgi:hypothetical protein